VPNFPVMSGTSFAAPQIYGAIAILMQQNSMLKTYPQMVKSLVIASAAPIQSTLEGGFTFLDSGLDQKLGAGLLNVNIAIKNNDPLVLPISSGTDGQVVQSILFFASANSFFRASLSNLILIRNNSDIDTQFTVYNVRVVDPNGNIVDWSKEPGMESFFSSSKTTYNNNVRINTFFALSGQYRLEIILYGTKILDTEYIGVTLFTW